jgi:hypothetical protein
MREPTQWYVSYTVKSHDGSRRYARKTRTFDSEELAKLFARETIGENLCPTAGTINPHSPKKVISSAAIATWLETPMQIDGVHGATEPTQFSYIARISTGGAPSACRANISDQTNKKSPGRSRG